MEITKILGLESITFDEPYMISVRSNFEELRVNLGCQDLIGVDIKNHDIKQYFKAVNGLCYDHNVGPPDL